MVGFDGDTGRLAKLLPVGVIGVLDGRSIGSSKFRIDPRGVSFGEDLLDLALRPVGTEGRLNRGFSSISSMDGKA